METLWMLKGACADADLDPEAWFNVPAASHPGVTPRELVEMCMGCPVFQECDAHADAVEEWGIWAGLSHWERYGREPRRGGYAQYMARPSRRRRVVA